MPHERSPAAVRSALDERLSARFLNYSRPLAVLLMEFKLVPTVVNAVMAATEQRGDQAVLDRGRALLVLEKLTKDRTSNCIS